MHDPSRPQLVGDQRPSIETQAELLGDDVASQVALVPHRVRLASNNVEIVPGETRLPHDAGELPGRDSSAALAHCHHLGDQMSPADPDLNDQRPKPVARKLDGQSVPSTNAVHTQFACRVLDHPQPAARAAGAACTGPR
jgi:hypothetical protein